MHNNSLGNTSGIRSKKPKFLMIASYGKSIIPFRGALIKSIQLLGMEVHMLFPNAENEVVCNELKNWGVVVHDYKLQRRGTSISFEIFTLLNLFVKIVSIKPRIILCYTIKPVIYTGLVKIIFRNFDLYPMITGLGYSFQKKENQLKITQKIAQKLYRLSLLPAKKVFFQNPDDLHLFRDNQILKSDTPFQIINGSGVDINFYSPCSLPTKISFLLIARLLNAKGIVEYLEAAQTIKQHCSEVNFKLVGLIESGVDSIPSNIINSLKSNYPVEFLGSLDDVRTAISNSSVYVLPSYREGTPRTVLEAMAMGRAIITTDVPGCRETVIDGHNGYLVPPRDSKALSQAMVRFLEDSSLAQKMGKRSREMAVEKYDVKKVNAVLHKEMNLIN